MHVVGYKSRLQVYMFQQAHASLFLSNYYIVSIIVTYFDYPLRTLTLEHLPGCASLLTRIYGRYRKLYTNSKFVF